MSTKVPAAPIPQTPEEANTAILDAVRIGLGSNIYKTLNDALAPGYLDNRDPDDKSPYRLIEGERNNRYDEFILGNPNTGETITVMRKYKPGKGPDGDDNWRIYMYQTADDVAAKKGVEVTMHSVFAGEGATTPTKPSRRQSAGRKRRKTRRRKTRR